MIPNPRKAVTIDFSLAELKAAVLRIPAYFHNKYQITDRNEVFNQYTFAATEFLSAGVFMDLNLTAVSDTRTEVAIEVRRKIGAFDHWHEVQNANTHIANFTAALTHLLMNARDPQKHTTVTAAPGTVDRGMKSRTNQYIVVGFLVLVVVIWVLGRFTDIFRH